MLCTLSIVVYSRLLVPESGYIYLYRKASSSTSSTRWAGLGILGAGGYVGYRYCSLILGIF